MENEKYGIVTGASRGLGVGCARELAREGYNLIITYKSNQDKAKEVADELEKQFNVNVTPYKLNIENSEEVREFRDYAMNNHGTNLSVLINNAGVYKNIPALEMEPEDFGSVIDINLKGMFYMCHYFATLMVNNQYGRIINLSSAVGLRGWPGTVAYAASKFGVRGLTQVLACELGPHNIAVNAIAPGSHKTDMFYEAPPEVREERTKNCPLKRAGEIEEMEYIVRYFMSSNFITGQVVSMNGGTTMV